MGGNVRWLLGELHRTDTKLIAAVTGARSPRATVALSAVSRTADHSVLWMSTALVIAAVGGSHGRRAAGRGMVAIAITSAVVSGALKRLSRRTRPGSAHHPDRMAIRRPTSHSFPSGHAASAFAFATAAGSEVPALAAPLGALAATVAFSRVYLGVHYPADVLVGAALGTAGGLASGPIHTALLERRDGAAVAEASPLPSRLLLVTNPRAGRARALQRSLRAARAAGLEVAGEVDVNDLGRLERLLAEAEEPVLVVAAGGDGTVGAVADHVADSAHAMGVLPLGTSNDFARSLGLPMAPERAARILAQGKLARIDLGRLVVAGDRPRHFVHAATVGLSVSFAKLATQTSLRRRLGRLTYAVAGAIAVRDRQPFACELDYGNRSERLTLTHLSIVNAPVFGGVLGIRMGESDVDDRVLDVLAVEPLPVRRLLLAGAQAALRMERRPPGVHARHVRRVYVRAESPLEVTLDGELAGHIPAHFEVAGEALRIVVPTTFEDVDGSLEMPTEGAA